MNTLLASFPAVGVGIFAARAAVALVLGAAVGLERQWRQRTAGLRTNALVALGAALFELFAVLLTGKQGVDPTRIAAYVVSGIGFLGAGVILRDGVTVRGINTAATIWCSAAVGVLAGAGYLPAAAIGAGLILLGHLALRPVARRVDRLPASTDTEIETSYTFRAICQVTDQSHIRALMVQELCRDGFVLQSVRSHDLSTGCGQAEITAGLHRHGRDDLALEAAVTRLSIEPSVSSVTWKACQPEELVAAGAGELARAARHRSRSAPSDRAAGTSLRGRRVLGAGVPGRVGTPPVARADAGPDEHDERGEPGRRRGDERSHLRDHPDAHHRLLSSYGDAVAVAVGVA